MTRPGLLAKIAALIHAVAPAAAQDFVGNPGVLLFGVSHRAYGNDASRSFLDGLTAFKKAQIATLASAALPLP